MKRNTWSACLILPSRICDHSQNEMALPCFGSFLQFLKILKLLERKSISATIYSEAQYVTESAKISA